MDKIDFSPSSLFDLSVFPFREIFDGIQNVWEVLVRIKDFTHGGLTKGENCFIHPMSNIREGVLLGNNVHVGFGVELKNCIVMSNTAIAHLSYVGDAIVGNTVNISGGAMLANFRLDHKPVTIKVNDTKVETGLEKFSAAIGDGTWIGVNSVVNPGTIIGKNSQVFPLTSVAGFYTDNSSISGFNVK